MLIRMLTSPYVHGLAHRTRRERLPRLGDRRAEDTELALRRVVPAELLCVTTRRRALEQATHGLRDRFGSMRRDQLARLGRIDDLCRASDVRRGHGRSTGHGLEQ